MPANTAPPRFFICLGAQKAGTTWLAQQLRAHPEFSLPPHKELGYFDSFYTGSFERVRQKKLVRLAENLNGLAESDESLSQAQASNLRWQANYAIVARDGYDDQWYWSLFRDLDPEKVTGDFSPNYSLLPEEGIRHMKVCAPHAKLFFILRNPVERTWSGALYALRKQIQKKKEIPSARRIRAATLSAIQRSFSDYRKIIQSYEGVFGSNSLNFLFYDDLKSDPLGFLQTFCEMNDVGFDAAWFKGVNKRINEGPSVEKNPQILAEIAKSSMEQLEWLAQRFGTVAQAWKRDAEAFLENQ
jgi:hypothetical protein